MRKIFYILFMLMPVAASAQVTQAQARAKVLGYNSENKYINFAFITDVHIIGKTWEKRYARENLEQFVSLCNERYCDFAAFGGDLFSAYDAQWGEAIEDIPAAMEYFNRIDIPVFMTKGNHDRNAKMTQEETITDVQYHLLCGRNTGNADLHCNPDDPYGNYFYVDYPEEKVRVITLNYYDSGIMQEAGIHGRQLDWLAKDALNPSRFPKGWTVLMFAHYYKECGEKFWKIVDRFNSKGKGSIAAFIHGHTHHDLYAVEHGINIIGVRCGFCSEKELGTPDENAFSVFTLDTDSRILHETRIGRGCNRDFPY
ncbi:MAG: metallophosphoesterase [Clostridium sp.]|nr:metallophosphoesterase [Bacteroides sp.]MCM1197715.1 metallophosphoesterase [Clostridium sp.]